MLLPWEREIWNGHDPVQLWRELREVFEGDPGPILAQCLSDDPEEKEEGRERVKARVGMVFPQAADPEADFLAFMAWVAAIKAEYLPWVEAGAPVNGSTYRDLCGLWFNRDRVRHRDLWVVYRALYLGRHGLPLPKECYDAISSSAADAAETQYVEFTDAVERAKVAV